jgi:hypothetical protein
VTDSLSLRCHCGALRGLATDMSPSAGNHVVCYCDDCQAYAAFLGRADIVDEFGGTEIFQTTPSRIRITSGKGELRCVRLTEKGLLRFYAGCCRTPVGNMISYPRMPFIGVVHSFIGDGSGVNARDAVLGPVTAKVQGRFAIGGVPPGADATMSLPVIVSTVSKLLRGFLARGHQPSAFFDARTKRPVVAAEVLTAEQRRALRPAPKTA